MQQTKLQNRIRLALRALLLLALAAVFAVFSSDAVNGRWAYYLPTTITVNGEEVVVNEALALNEYTEADFALDEDGRMTCLTSGWRTGIDVSAHQGDIDWEAVAADGVSFAMLRVGFRGYGAEGTLNLDESFLQNAQAALAAGVEIGVYFFSQATSVEEAEEEAAFVLEQLEGLDITFPVAYDWEIIDAEDSGEGGARTDDVDEETSAACAEAFCAAVTQAGYRAALYVNNQTGYFSYDDALLQSYFLWYAGYEQSYPDYYYAVDLWQYTESGTVDGITGSVDLNIYPIETDPADSGSTGGTGGGSASGSLEADTKSSL
ncbi:MAG: lysozyme [Clostridiales bacterium]|nr:lysozyme [Clostridiales bacterium]